MADPSTSKQRWVSLDAFRGATIALMVLVNDPGDGANVYWPLRHSEWHGWTPTDVVFPSFLWIAGMAMTISLARRAAAGVGRTQLFLQMLRRCAIIYALGLFVYGFPHFDLATWRILGVLQRIAICLLAGAAIWLTTGIRGRVAWLLALLGGYWALMAFVPVPGYGAGRLDVAGNLAHYVDRLVLGAHNYAPTKTWDPEGIVSTLPAIASVLFGMLAGEWMSCGRSLRDRLLGFAAAGAVLLAVASFMDPVLPVNKKLWTSTFAIFMAGLDCVLFAAFAWLADGARWRRPFRPFVILGMNAIAIYMASEVGDVLLNTLDWHEPIYRTVFAPLASPMNASLLYALAYTLLMWAIAWVMYRRGWFIKV